MKGQSWIVIGGDLTYGEQGDVGVESVVNGSNHFARCQRFPKRAVEINNAAVDANMNASIGSAGKDKWMFTWLFVNPFE